MSFCVYDLCFSLDPPRESATRSRWDKTFSNRNSLGLGWESQRSLMPWPSLPRSAELQTHVPRRILEACRDDDSGVRAYSLRWHRTPKMSRRTRHETVLSWGFQGCFEVARPKSQLCLTAYSGVTRRLGCEYFLRTMARNAMHPPGIARKSTRFRPFAAPCQVLDLPCLQFNP